MVGWVTVGLGTGGTGTYELGVILAIVSNIMGITAVIYEFVGGIWNGETQMTVGDSV